jgi:C4-dicarboxylate transporter DctQ subunit
MKLLDHLEEWIVTVMLVLMTCLTFLQVVLRYVFNSGFTWALELTTLFFAVMIFVGIGYGIRVGFHIGIDALVVKLPPRIQHVMGVVVVLLCLLYAGIVLYGSFQYVSKMYTVGIEMQDLPIPVWLARSVLPLGYALLIFRLGQVFWRLVTGQLKRFTLGDEAADALKLRALEEQS